MIGRQVVLNAYWAPINFQTAALMTIAVPAALVGLAGPKHISTFAALAAMVAVISMLVPPLFGGVSDALSRRGMARQPVVLLGAAINVGALIWMMHAPTTNVFGIAVLVAALGQNISQAAYQALLPEVVAPKDWGAASGYMGAASLIGSVAGLAVARLAQPATVFAWAAVLIAAGAIAVMVVPRGRPADGERARVRNWRDFIVAFFSRSWTSFGLALLATFVFYFFSDVLKVENPAATAGSFGVLALVGAVISSLWLGRLSDYLVRKRVVALAGVPMALAALGFAASPRVGWIFALALLFGIGYGGFVSTGWALGIDSVPRLRNVARDLGVWGIAANLPGVLAPVAGKWLLARSTDLAGNYRVLFAVAGLSFVLGSLVVLFVGRSVGRGLPALRKLADQPARRETQPS